MYINDCNKDVLYIEIVTLIPYHSLCVVTCVVVNWLLEKLMNGIDKHRYAIKVSPNGNMSLVNLNLKNRVMI